MTHMYQLKLRYTLNQYIALLSNRNLPSFSKWGHEKPIKILIKYFIAYMMYKRGFPASNISQLPD